MQSVELSGQDPCAPPHPAHSLPELFITTLLRFSPPGFRTTAHHDRSRRSVWRSQGPPARMALPVLRDTEAGGAARCGSACSVWFIKRPSALRFVRRQHKRVAQASEDCRAARVMAMLVGQRPTPPLPPAPAARRPPPATAALSHDSELDSDTAPRLTPSELWVVDACRVELDKDGNVSAPAYPPPVAGSAPSWHRHALAAWLPSLLTFLRIPPPRRC